MKASHTLFLTASLLCFSIQGLAFSKVVAEKNNRYPHYPTLSYPAGEKGRLIKRGEYLTMAGDCIACHTPPGGKAFSGSYPVKTPFGTIYSPNITSDKKHGIGNWTQAQFNRAMRQGISPEGNYYYPAFPYLYFNSLTDEDLKAIKAYLDRVPAVSLPNKKNSMKFPFNWRFMQIGWRTLFFTAQKPGIFKPNPKRSTQWNRGAYLVNGLGHCSMCHTPSYYAFSKNLPLAAPVHKYFLAGNKVEGYFAPNITSLLLKKASDQEVIQVFKEDKLIGGGKIQSPPMLEVNHDSLQYLTNEDLIAIGTYLRSVKSHPLPKAGGTGLAAGKAIYEQYCTGCHTTGAGGAPKFGNATAWEPLIKNGMAALYKNAIHGIGGMPAKGSCISCSDKDIQYAVQYMVSKSKPGVGTASAPAAKPVKQLTLAQGKQIYNRYCAVCHDPGSKYLNAPKIGDKATWQPILKKGIDKAFYNTIHGYGNMAARGACTQCNGAEIKAAVKYMAQESKTSGDYSLW